MASEEHKLLAQYIKEVHLSLRKATSKLGGDTAWQEHCKDDKTLSNYAHCMEKLATTHWENSCNSGTSEAQSRIKWVVDFCYDYFHNRAYMNCREKEIIISQKMDVPIHMEETFSEPLKLLDVGSCYNPFKQYNIFDVFAIDLYPANTSVLQCDFLEVNIGPHNVLEGSTVNVLQENSFDVATFCFLLEYIPTSKLRIKACEKAYSILKPGGLLIINTPDSKHVGANSKIMKCWRYTLAHMGFNRIKYEKLKYMHCMAYRKTLNKETARRWASMYKEPYMEYAIQIPQDFNMINEVISEPINHDTVPDLHVDDFQVLPFCNVDVS